MCPGHEVTKGLVRNNALLNGLPNGDGEQLPRAELIFAGEEVDHDVLDVKKRELQVSADGHERGHATAERETTWRKKK